MCTQQTKNVSFEFPVLTKCSISCNWNDDFLSDNYFHKGNYLYIAIPMSTSISVCLCI